MPRYEAKSVPSSNIVTQSEFARLIGVRPQTIQDFKLEDRLVLEYHAGRDKVMVKESIDKLNATAKLHDPFTNHRRDKSVNPGDASPDDLESVTQLDLETDNADLLYKNAKALKEKSAALQAAAEHQKFIGSLVEREVVNKIIFERARQFRDGSLVCTRRLAPELSGKTDMKEIESILTREFRYMLDEFSKLPVVE